MCPNRSYPLDRAPFVQFPSNYTVLASVPSLVAPNTFVLETQVACEVHTYVFCRQTYKADALGLEGDPQVIHVLTTFGLGFINIAHHDAFDIFILSLQISIPARRRQFIIVSIMPPVYTNYTWKRRSRCLAFWCLSRRSLIQSMNQENVDPDVEFTDNHPTEPSVIRHMIAQDPGMFFNTYCKIIDVCL
ncbi:hypothetical protein RF11_02909 [Thelohanellus kitauei]|uniref:Uncharacterized protein n=1 Tax=Thelohanellus kitauei TaxID=669202 RepID=A0A0C2N4W0_THEKT|nr:hypothetical protein RF11_02909 [Thelohanellus kitauei]